MPELTDQDIKLLEIASYMRRRIDGAEPTKRVDTLWHAVGTLKEVCAALGIQASNVARLRLKQFLAFEQADTVYDSTFDLKPVTIGDHALPEDLFYCWLLLESAEVIIRWFAELPSSPAPRDPASGR